MVLIGTPTTLVLVMLTADTGYTAVTGHTAITRSHRRYGKPMREPEHKRFPDSWP
jgi:hypothetical protein